MDIHGEIKEFNSELIELKDSLAKCNEMKDNLKKFSVSRIVFKSNTNSDTEEMYLFQMTDITRNFDTGTNNIISVVSGIIIEAKMKYLQGMIGGALPKNKGFGWRFIRKGINKMDLKAPTITLEYSVLIKVTDKAWLLEIQDTKEWFPQSQCAIDKDRQMIRVPE